jgi:hypothetical protein
MVRDDSPDREIGSAPIGGPLGPAEAAYLRSELSERGIPADLWPEPGTPGVKTHLVLVAPHDAERARGVREHVLSDEPPRTDRPASPGRRFGPFAAGALGALVGIRLGARFHGHAWLVVLPLILGSTAFLAASRAGRRGAPPS